jgi:hypothetical protein
MGNAVKAMLVKPGKYPEVVELERDPEGGYLPAMQDAVGGFIEPFDVLFEGSPTLYVNEEGVFTQMPNRVVMATEEMHEAGYLSQLHPDHVVEAGEPYTLLFGNILAVSYDEDGDLRDLEDAEIARVCRAFATRESLYSVRELFKEASAA